MNSLESVQALIIAACYSAERSLILSFATRMALDRHLDGAFDRLTQQMLMNGAYEIRPEDEDNRLLVRESRIWLGLLVLEHMYIVPISFFCNCHSDYLDSALTGASLRVFD